MGLTVLMDLEEPMQVAKGPTQTPLMHTCTTPLISFTVLLRIDEHSQLHVGAQ